jgi:hypothetical protein
MGMKFRSRTKNKKISFGSLRQCSSKTLFEALKLFGS